MRWVGLLAAGLVVVGCSDAEEARRPLAMSDIVSEVECRRSEKLYFAQWAEDENYDCTVAGRFVRFHKLSDLRHGAAVGGLASRSTTGATRCPDGTEGTIFVVDGEDWVAATLSSEAADEVAAAFGGERQPVEAPGPPISYGPPPCPP